MRSYLDARSNYFADGGGVPFFVVTGQVNYSSIDTQKAVEALFDDLQSEYAAPFVARSSLVSWQRNMRSWLTFEAHTNQYLANDKWIPPALFDDWLREFSLGRGAAHSIDLVWRHRDGRISVRCIILF